ncbi:HlyB/MsbA family ABC transporter [Vararia minispora EC-137]|uniref:HlyB/MsbA family ABC transporter n=1 Tax=Vararia minispora EC-137 TaxID=1314806 RepID=A0ACB8Q5U6_9AGAM|nr:HlyB/MsbA family ABC transporter [Vararia minispora EC-137]
MGRGSKGGTRRRRRQGTFKPDDPTIEHHKLGVWDLYVQRDLPPIAWLGWLSRWGRFEDRAEVLNDLRYLWKAVYDLRNVCLQLFIYYAATTIAMAMIPAINLWYSGQLLDIATIATVERTVDRTKLCQVAGGKFACSMALLVVGHVHSMIQRELNSRIKRYYSVHTFHALARLDVPTFEDPVVNRQIDSVLPGPGERRTIPWAAISAVFSLGSSITHMLSQSLVLLDVLSKQQDGILLAGLSALGHLFQINAKTWGTVDKTYLPAAGVWAATSNEDDFLRMEGYKRVVGSETHRKELVAGGLADYMTEQYSILVGRLGSRAGDFFQIHAESSARRLNFSKLINHIFQQLPQIVFTLRAAQYPASIPVSMASLHLIQQSSASFLGHITEFMDSTDNLAEKLSSLRKLYEADKIPVKVPDGTRPFPEDTRSLYAGVSLELRNVSFRYPGSDRDAVNNISFKLEPGQLCVVVGSNGSGKSTILKLISRIYDVTEGVVLLDGKDIRSLKLRDLRQAMAILFQDYTHFPLSIKENIALGDPENAHDEDRVREAARLAGAEEIIEHQEDGIDTYLQRPVRDYYSELPEGTTTLFGRTVDHRGMRRMIGEGPQNVSLSGGQMQRLAVARTFMRSIPSSSSDTKVGLLLFDEPSASLDPAAEHDLFARLRELRGNKTMIFSTHRFGNLTRHADLILYMNNSTIVEAGTHEQLLQCDGEYAKLWKMQAEAFL